jgi:hypothetical protein
VALLRRPPSALRLPRQHWLEILPSIALRIAGDLLGRAFGDHLAPAVAALRPHVDDPVGGLHHFQILLDDDHRVALVDQLVQHVKQLRDVVEVEPRGRLVEDVERAAGRAARQFLGELDALRLAAGQRRRLLTGLDIAQAQARDILARQ